MKCNVPGRLRTISLTVLLSTLCGAAGASAPTWETPEAVIDATERGIVRVSQDGSLEEEFAFARDLSNQLAEVSLGESVRLLGWPVSPGDHRSVSVQRKDLYAADARMFEVGEHGTREISRSPRLYFVGQIEDEPGSGILVILDPRTGKITGMSVSNGRSFDLLPATGGEFEKGRVVATQERMAALDPEWACGEEALGSIMMPPATTTEAAQSPAASSSGQLEAVLAIDTDTELLSQKFSNNTSAAADYVADLIAAMNVMYTRDLGVTFLQGTTYLRTGSDPWTANSGGSASISELNEFGNYWKSHYGSAERTVAAMLSGKSPSSNQASGIAWVGGLCSSTYGYSFSKVFKANYLSGDAKLVGHEIGHNFGSKHTHCYSPPIDTCYAYEGGCYSGSTSCPSGGPGTVMSYCHITGCGSTLDFHPTVINNILTNHVGPATGVCIFEDSSSAPGSLFDDGFESGGFNEWSSVSN